MAYATTIYGISLADVEQHVCAAARDHIAGERFFTFDVAAKLVAESCQRVQ